MPAKHREGDAEIRSAEVIGALSLATDLSIGFDYEHGLRSTIVAVRLAELLGVDSDARARTFYECLLQQVGCTADIHLRAEILGDTQAAIRDHLMSAWFGSSGEMAMALARSVAPGRPVLVRAAEAARTVPRAARAMPRIDVACREVARMLIERLSLPAPIAADFAFVDERWDGKGEPGRAAGDQIPESMRIAHVARDIDVQRVLGGIDLAAEVVADRAGSFFDPEIARCFTENANEILSFEDEASVWDEALRCEPGPARTLGGAGMERALGAIGDFADLVSPHFSGHSSGVSALASSAAERCGLGADSVMLVRRAGLVHDVGRVAVTTAIWQKPGPLTPGDWEHVRLHPYHSDRVLSRSPFLAALAPVATAHHERLDGSGYHRGTGASGLSREARLLAAADAYRAMISTRPHRGAMSVAAAANELTEEVREGRLDPTAVQAVLEVAGHSPPRLERPAGLTERESEVVGLIARGLQTKQVAITLGISVKTADRHIQNSYSKIGVSTRAAVALFAMEHGLVTWGELPIAPNANRS